MLEHLPTTPYYVPSSAMFLPAFLCVSPPVPTPLSQDVAFSCITGHTLSKWVKASSPQSVF